LIRLRCQLLRLQQSGEKQEKRQGAREQSELLFAPTGSRRDPA
jgi:hypothetical protein